MGWKLLPSLMLTRVPWLKREDGEFPGKMASFQVLCSLSIMHPVILQLNRLCLFRSLTICQKKKKRFLLKYIARDELVVLGQGTGGVPEMRNSISAYEEKSPLYGFLQYRRRKVIIKYMPEGLSRLVQGTNFFFFFFCFG